MKKFIKYVGLGVQGKTIAFSVANIRSSELHFSGQISSTPEAVVKLVNQLANKGAVLSFFYEAGP